MSKEISILEDDSDIREICTYFFRDEGFHVNSYESVGELIAKPATPDLFLLDIRLPDGNGLDVCRILKSDHRYNGIPIIMMSAHMDMASMRHGCRADHFISKPFDLDLLLRKVESLIKKNQL